VLFDTQPRLYEIRRADLFEYTQRFRAAGILHGILRQYLATAWGKLKDIARGVITTVEAHRSRLQGSLGIAEDDTHRLGTLALIGIVYQQIAVGDIQRAITRGSHHDGTGVIEVAAQLELGAYRLIGRVLDQTQEARVGLAGRCIYFAADLQRPDALHGHHQALVVLPQQVAALVVSAAIYQDGLRAAEAVVASGMTGVVAVVNATVAVDIPSLQVVQRAIE